MPNLKSLFKDTAIYGMSTIVGRFLNYLLVPLYTVKISAASGGYGVVTNVYAYTALLMVLLTYGMETTFFRYANKEGQDVGRVYSTTLCSLGATALGFVALVLLCLKPVSGWMGYAEHPEWIGVMAVVVAIDAFRCIPFALLRLQKKAMKFAALQLFNILLTITFNLIYFIPLGGDDVGAIFYINLVCSVATTLLLYRELAMFRPSQASRRLLTEMLRYAWPILVLGLAGILNQTADKLLFPYIYKGEDGLTQLGIYGACVKIAMIMAMITQAFRYAYEPFIFGGSRQKEQDQKQTQAQAMLYFVLCTLLAYLAVVGYMPLLRHLIGQDYWSGLRVVPIVMAAEMMMGIYFNLSFWYKLTDRTIWGAIFSGVGCAVLIGVNVAFVPRYGYMACAWGGVAGYGVAMLLSYFVGQHYYPVRFPLAKIFTFVALCAVFAWVMNLLNNSHAPLTAMALNTLLLAVFAAAIAWPMLRHRRSVTLLAACLMVLTATAQQKKQPVQKREAAEFYKDFPKYADLLLKDLTYPLAWGNSPERDLDRWREQGRRKVRECMLTPPPPPKNGWQTELLAEEQRDGYRAMLLELNLSEYYRVKALLLVPDGEGPFPAVNALHDHGAHLYIGKEKMIRPLTHAKRPDGQPWPTDTAVVADADRWAESLYEGQYMGDHLARQGYVVLSTDAPMWGERGREEGVDRSRYDLIAGNMMMYGVDLSAYMTYDDIAATDYLASLPWVDAERIACVGCSMGAYRAWMLAALSDRIKVGCAVCWMVTTDVQMTWAYGRKENGGFANCIPGLRRWMDYPHIASLAAPKPMLFLSGRQDKLFPVPGVEKAFSQMRQVWHDADADSCLATELWDMPHSCPRKAQQRVLDFLKRHL